jgi:hypothetical protein
MTGEQSADDTTTERGKHGTGSGRLRTATHRLPHPMAHHSRRGEPAGKKRDDRHLGERQFDVRYPDDDRRPVAGELVNHFQCDCPVDVSPGQEGDTGPTGTQLGQSGAISH